MRQRYRETLGHFESECDNDEDDEEISDVTAKCAHSLLSLTYVRTATVRNGIRDTLGAVCHMRTLPQVRQPCVALCFVLSTPFATDVRSTMSFSEFTDNTGAPYFRWVTNSTDDFTIDSTLDFTSFLKQELRVRRLITAIFTRDLTPHDDILLAVLSLFLLFLIHDIVTTVLLRTHHGQVSTFSFSVKQVVELAREFRLSRIFNGPRAPGNAWPRHHRRKTNVRLVAIAVFVIGATFGLEVLVLFLTNQEFSAVHNSDVYFELRHPFNPTWEDVRYHNTASLNRPCLAISLLPVDQGHTRISACVSSTLSSTEFRPFQNESTPTRLIIQSDWHVYGAEHRLRIDEMEVNYSARAFFNLGDELPRIMMERSRAEQVEGRMEVVHRQLIALLFSVYHRETGDETMNLERLQQLDDGNFAESNIRFLPDPDGGGEVNITQVSENGTIRDVQVTTTRFFTLVNAIVPRGEPAFRVAHQVFKASMGIQVKHGRNETDLVLGRGVEQHEAVVWQEDGRALNWLSLLIILVITTAVLLLLRLFLKPVATAEIAGLLVKEGVGARWDRSPLMLGEYESDAFRVPWRGVRGEHRDSVGIDDM